MSSASSAVSDERERDSNDERRSRITAFRRGITIARIDTPSFREWEAIWRACDYATFFHSPYWAELWERFTGNRRRSAAERITFSDGRVAIVPLVMARTERPLGERAARAAPWPRARPVQ